MTYLKDTYNPATRRTMADTLRRLADAIENGQASGEISCHIEYDEPRRHYFGNPYGMYVERPRILGARWTLDLTTFGGLLIDAVTPMPKPIVDHDRGDEG